MAIVYIPPLLQSLSGGRDTISLSGSTVGQLVAELERRFPGIRERLCVGDALRPGLSVFVDNEAVRLGLSAPVGTESEVHFLPTIGGGSTASS
jgi:molybdopterin synthase sulfur carrier subunit